VVGSGGSSGGWRWTVAASAADLLLVEDAFKQGRKGGLVVAAGSSAILQVILALQ